MIMGTTLLLGASAAALASTVVCTTYDNVASSRGTSTTEDGCSVQSLSKNVDFLGRFSDIDTVPIADWSTSGIRFAARVPTSGNASQSATIKVQFAPCGSGCNFFVDVSIDCVSVLVFNSSDQHNSLDVKISNAEPGRIYDVSIRKITEAVYGASASTIGFSSLQSEGLEISKASEYASLRGHCNDNTAVASTLRSMLFFGDSITAGYGNLDEDPCPFSLATESSLATYAAFTAKALGAANSFHTIAWSGRGMVRNYADVNTVSAKPMPYYYNRTLAGRGWDVASDKYWSASQFPADVFVVALGTNDYSVDPVPSDEEYINGKISLFDLYNYNIVSLSISIYYYMFMCSRLRLIPASSPRGLPLGADRDSMPAHEQRPSVRQHPEGDGTGRRLSALH
jgi:hypothetical protein